jgi:hypothetical protein
MITQEMKEFAAEAIVNVGSAAACLSWDEAQKYAEAAITAVYPLILEEAALVCDYQIEFFKGDKALAGKCCARAIRNLKDKTDEAHNR